MFFITFKNWLKHEKMYYNVLHNRRVLRLYKLYKLQAPKVIIDKELKLVKQSFLNYLCKKYFYTYLKSLLHLSIMYIFPNFTYNLILWLDYKLKNFYD